MPSDIPALEAYRRRTLFTDTGSKPGWGGYVSPAIIDATRILFDELLDKLIRLGPDASNSAVEDALRDCVERINELDGTFDGFATIEREDLCETLYEIGSLCGMPEDEEWVDQWREW